MDVLRTKDAAFVIAIAGGARTTQHTIAIIGELRRFLVYLFLGTQTKGEMVVSHRRVGRLRWDDIGT